MLIEWQDFLFTFPIQHPQNKEFSVTRTNLLAHHPWIRQFHALFTDVLSYITMSVVVIVPRTFLNMHTMNYVSYKYSVSIYPIISCLPILKLGSIIVFFCSFRFWIGCRGNYGDGCLYACPTNCLNGKCEEHTGHCLRCSAGYYGQLCLYGLYYSN